MCPSRTRDKEALTSRPDQSPWAGLPYCGDRCICMLAWHHSILSTHFPALTTDSLAVWLNYAFPCSAACSQRILRYLTRVLIFLVNQKFQHVNKSSKSVNTESMSRPFDMFWNPDWISGLLMLSTSTSFSLYLEPDFELWRACFPMDHLGSLPARHSWYYLSGIRTTLNAASSNFLLQGVGIMCSFQVEMR